MRIGLTYSAWKADVLPLNYTRNQLTYIIIIMFGHFVNKFFKFFYFFLILFYELDIYFIPLCKRKREILSPPHYFPFFSLLRLSFIICISFGVINVQLFSFAHLTHPFSTVFKNTLGTLTSIAHASSVN